jgi:hypothetical protein
MEMIESHTVDCFVPPSFAAAAFLLLTLETIEAGCLDMDYTYLSTTTYRLVMNILSYEMCTIGY